MDTVKYIGPASRRVIYDHEWEKAGVSNEDTVVWDMGNGYTVDAGKMSQAARDAIKADPWFVWSNREDVVEQEVTIDVDLAKEFEAAAKDNATSTDGTGLDTKAGKKAKGGE